MKKKMGEIIIAVKGLNKMMDEGAEWKGNRLKWQRKK